MMSIYELKQLLILMILLAAKLVIQEPVLNVATVRLVKLFGVTDGGNCMIK
jgi:hypothetical protein